MSSAPTSGWVLLPNARHMRPATRHMSPHVVLGFGSVPRQASALRLHLRELCCRLGLILGVYVTFGLRRRALFSGGEILRTSCFCSRLFFLQRIRRGDRL